MQNLNTKFADFNVCESDDTIHKLEEENHEMQKLIVKLTRENSKLLEVVAEDKHQIAEIKQKILQLESEKVEDKRKIAQLKSENAKHKCEKILLNPPQIDLETLEKHSWNSDDRSLNLYIKLDDQFTFHRYPVTQSTDCIRGKIGYSKSIHIWEIIWPQTMRGTNAVIGVATNVAPLHKKGYSTLIGENNESYGWNLVKNECSFDSITWKYPNVEISNDEKYIAPEKIFCILDMNEGLMAFSTANNYLGVAFRGLKGKKLYPIVGCVWGHCEVTMKYLGGYDECMSNFAFTI
uniref:B30.2/SPRY domain-containing protein n=1 Tax=Panagrolaimus davidi TaxID=227884 RepID=A0A914Q846_9BILA